jgi:hypothetical protein
MSCMILSPRHIDTIASAFADTWTKAGDAPLCWGGPRLESVAQALLDQNILAYNACYPEDDPQEPMKARGKFEATTPAQLLKAILCYECQTCEAPDFEGSALFKQLQIIKHRAMSALIKDCDWAIPDYTHTVTAHAA